jgi:hypothetical protein
MAENLHSLQTAFAAHIRDPENQTAPADVEDRRMDIYRQLFFNNINKFLSNNFPVIRQLYQDDAWLQLVRDFYREHRCHTPLFPELPKEFLRYLQQQRMNRAGDPPYLLELAHYERVELALSLDENELDQSRADREGDLMKEVPVLSPLAWPLSYRYPVHRIKPGFEIDSPPDQATHLLVYRNREDRIRFMQLNDVSRLLLHKLLEDKGMTGHQLLTDIASDINHPQTSAVLDKGARLLRELLDKDILLGTRTGV